MSEDLWSKIQDGGDEQMAELSLWPGLTQLVTGRKDPWEEGRGVECEASWRRYLLGWPKSLF